MDNQQPSINTSILNCKPSYGKGFIYKYTSPSGKGYIGQTQSTLYSRAKSLNGTGYKNCSVFYKAIQKYGFSNMEVEILEECLIEDLNEKEKFWINYYNTQTPNGYNISEGGDEHSKKIYQYDCETGEFLAEYPSITAAATVNNIEHLQSLSDNVCGRTKTSYGYIWKLEKVERVDPQKWHSKEPKEVYAYYLSGKFFRKFDSITQAAKIVGTQTSSIRKALKGQIKYCGNYIWKDFYTDRVSPVVTSANGSIKVRQYDLETGKTIQIFGSQSEAARALGLSRSSGIAKCCSGKQKSCAGYGWEIYEGSTTIYP